MSDENKQNQTPQQPAPKEQPKAEPKPVELPKPNQGEVVTKGGQVARQFSTAESRRSCNQRRIGGAPVFNWHEIRKRKRKGSKTRPHSSSRPRSSRAGQKPRRGNSIPPEKQFAPPTCPPQLQRRRSPNQFSGFSSKKVRILTKRHRIKQKSITRPVYSLSLACCNLL